MTRIAFPVPIIVKAKINPENFNKKIASKILVEATLLENKLPKAIPLIKTVNVFKPAPLVDDKFSIITKASIIIFSILICL